MADNNIDVNSGSAVDLEASQRQKGQLNDETTLYNSMLQTYGYRVNATSDTVEAQLDTATAENAPIGAGLSAFGSLLGNNKFTGWIGGTGAGAATTTS